MAWTASASGTKTPTVAGICTISNASPAVVTFTNGFAAGDMIVLTTSGTLPTGLSPFVLYFVIAAGLSGSVFEVSATLGGAAINTSGAGSGAHTCTPIQVLTTDTTIATYQFISDTTNNVAGDVVKFRCWTTTLSGGVQSVAWTGAYTDVQSVNAKIAPPFASDISAMFTISQLGGTARAYPWKVLRQ